jgi:anti-anti-sigma factor
MSALTPPLRGDELLAAVTEAMVALHERYYHRAPVSAKTQMLGEDLLACVMGGVYTEVEKTMIELQRGTMVQETRSEQALRDAQSDASRVVLDLQALTLIDCASLSVVFDAAVETRRRDAVLILLDPRGQMRRVLDLTGAPEGVAVLASSDAEPVAALL